MVSMCGSACVGAHVWERMRGSACVRTRVRACVGGVRSRTQSACAQILNALEHMDAVAQSTDALVPQAPTVACIPLKQPCVRGDPLHMRPVQCMQRMRPPVSTTHAAHAAHASSGIHHTCNACTHAFAGMHFCPLRARCPHDDIGAHCHLHA
eukprot:363224-Chlamydomonas_euryale.AAC.7